ncbi:MAG: DNA-processing protein DprA [Cellvibrionaceae bacterium]|nr:DNA-processing protein DprA [Cellvibrionaceae bacterium]
MLSDKQQLLLFQRLPGVGAAVYWKLLERFKSLQAAIIAPPNHLFDLLPEEALQQLAELRKHGESSAIFQQIRQDIAYAEVHSIHILDNSDTLYPELLRQIKRPPPLLFVAGDPLALSLPQIAVVGSRSPTPPGRKTAFEFSATLAASGFTVTSGLALGVDASAHQGALSVGGRTIAVLGSGIDQIYPYRNQSLAQEIITKGGALVSEFPLGTSALPANFPQRNRIISGLSCGTLVVEAALKSGSLITARYALQQSREVFAIPGSIHSPVSKGCHDLIKNGAKLVETARDVVEELSSMLELHWQQTSLPLSEQVPLSSAAEPGGSDINTTENERLILDCLGYDPTSIDEVAQCSKLPVGEVMANLMTLELKGRVANSGNGYVLAT